MPHIYTPLSASSFRTPPTDLDLKDVVFSIPLIPQIFAFTWTDLDTLLCTQLTCSILSQGFWNSSHLSVQHLASVLLSLSLPKHKFIQYVDCLLFCSPSLQISQADTNNLLNFLSSQSYRVSLSKVQLPSNKLQNLGLTSTPNSQSHYFRQKMSKQPLTLSTINDEILSLGVDGFLHCWIPSFSPLACPWIRWSLSPYMSPSSY